MAGEERKVELKIDVDSAEVQAGLDQINRGAKDMAQNVVRAGEVAAAGISAVGDGADATARKVEESQRKISDSIKRTSDVVSGQAVEGIAKLDTEMTKGATTLSAYGKTAQQTQAALSGMPIHLTDIVTSLHGGRHLFPWCCSR